MSLLALNVDSSGEKCPINAVIAIGITAMGRCGVNGPVKCCFLPLPFCLYSAFQTQASCSMIRSRRSEWMSCLNKDVSKGRMTEIVKLN
jgi:hypothetical protein